MNERIDRNEPLRAELAELRAALASVAPPPVDEAALRAAFRAQAVRSRVAARRGPAIYWATAASIAVLVGVGALVLAGRTSPPAVATAAAPPPPAAVETVFQPLLFAPGWAPSATYSVVRVRIPLSSFAVAQDAIVDGAVEADLLIGEDGLARGIRFPPQDTLGVSATAN